jgi:hypothetical protein
LNGSQAEFLLYKVDTEQSILFGDNKWNNDVVNSILTLNLTCSLLIFLLLSRESELSEITKNNSQKTPHFTPEQYVLLSEKGMELLYNPADFYCYFLPLLLVAGSLTLKCFN